MRLRVAKKIVAAVGTDRESAYSIDQIGRADRIIDKLELAGVGKDLPGYGVQESEAWNSLPESMRRELLARVHRKFHYVVVRWLQEQGASVT